MQDSDSNLNKRVYLKLLLLPSCLILVGLVFNIILSLGIERLSLPRMTGVFLKLRMKEAIEKIQDVHGDKKYAYFWGASEIESGLDTNLINQILEEKKMGLEAVNMGMRSIHPTVYLAFIDRIANELEKQNKRIEISFVKFPTNKMTKTYYKHYPLSESDDQLGPVLRLTNWDYGKKYPYTYFSGLAHHYLFKDASLIVSSEILEEQLAAMGRNFDHSPQKIYFAPWLDSTFLDPELWSAKNAGTYGWNLPESKEEFELALERKKAYAVRFSSYAYFEQCCGLANLDFDRRLLSDFFESVEILKRVSNRVVVYTIPETDEYNLWRNNSYGRRMSKVLNSVATTTGVEVISGDAGVHLNDEDFMDFLHLNPKGQLRFYNYLLDAVNEAQ